MAHKAGTQLSCRTFKDLVIALAIVAAVLGVVALDGRDAHAGTTDKPRPVATTLAGGDDGAVQFALRTSRNGSDTIAGPASASEAASPPADLPQMVQGGSALVLREASRADDTVFSASSGTLDLVQSGLVSTMHVRQRFQLPLQRRGDLYLVFDLPNGANVSSVRARVGPRHFTYSPEFVPAAPEGLARKREARHTVAGKLAPRAAGAWRVWSAGSLARSPRNSRIILPTC